VFSHCKLGLRPNDPDRLAKVVKLACEELHVPSGLDYQRLLELAGQL
jgi:hypothetical protein